ncbi:MAG TPA: Ig-like domain-containing protein [Candidatus Eisenbacteria bacterium]|nr:Ig-like domain-containing protein [Candidatus Eisenbacteria bacterium]
MRRGVGSARYVGAGFVPAIAITLGLLGRVPAEAASAAKVCRRSCTAAIGECLAGAKQERTARLAVCTSGAADRRTCQREVARAAHATGRACGKLRKGCTACCRARGTACDQPQVTRDQGRAASGLIAISGGTLTATAADGTTYTLTVPADALLDDTTITLTPVTAIGGFAVGRDLVAAVDAEPSGLLFLKPATLTITLPRAPAERLLGFGYEGDGTDFHGELLAANGTTARLIVTHFSGFGAGPESSPELHALLARPPSSASQQFDGQLANLASQGVTDLQTYVDLFRRWYQQVIRPQLQGAVGSDPALRQALKDYDQWFTELQNGLLLIGLNAGTALAPEQAEALTLIAAALRDAVARADARCLAQHSLAEAERALEWQVIAAAADVDTPANALDLDTVLDGLCVEAHYDDLSYPNDPPLGVRSELRLHVGLDFIDGARASGDRMLVDITPHGTVELTVPADTNPDRSFAIDFTPRGDRELRLDIHSCGDVPGRRRLKSVCQDAFVVRGFEVRPPTATVAPGGTQQFGAFLFDQPTTNITWSATGGTVDATGRFTAGSQSGSFKVRATSTVDQNVATAEVTIGSATTTTVPSTTTSTTLPVPTGTATFNVNLPPGSDPMFVVAGTFNVSISHTSGGGFDASASWPGATMFFGSSTGCPGAEYGLHDVGGSHFTMVSPVVGQLTIGGIQVTSPPGGCFTSSGFTAITFGGLLLQPDVIQFFSVCIASTCYDSRFVPGVQVGGVVQISGAP